MRHSRSSGGLGMSQLLWSVAKKSHLVIPDIQRQTDAGDQGVLRVDY